MMGKALIIPLMLDVSAITAIQTLFFLGAVTFFFSGRINATLQQSK
jgi:hypothetical protein